MKYNPMEARCVFIDGPVAIYLSSAAEDEILEAYRRLGKMVAVAAHELAVERKEKLREDFAARTQLGFCDPRKMTPEQLAKVWEDAQKEAARART